MLSRANIKAIEQVLSMEDTVRREFLAGLSDGAQGLLEHLFEQYEERLK